MTRTTLEIPQATTKVKRYTLAQYLALEERSLTHHEYDNGTVIAMPGGSPNHSKIKARVVTLFNNIVDASEQPKDVYNSDIRVWLPDTQRSVMPDAAVVADKPDFSVTLPVGLLLNPTLIVEVFSASSESYDRGEKFKLYRTLPSFTEYILISQEKPRVETFVKQNGKWFLHEDAAGMESSVEIVTLGAAILLKDLYKNIVFEAPPRSRVRKKS